MLPTLFQIEYGGERYIGKYKGNKYKSWLMPYHIFKDMNSAAISGAWLLSNCVKA